MSNIGNLRKCSIDSLKLRFPIPVLDSYSETLDYTNLKVIKETGEIEKEWKTKSTNFLPETFNYSLRASKSASNIAKGQRVECIEILINSKQLEARYFEGITLDNICIIYNLVIETGIIECSFRTFMNESLVTDIDFKKDFCIPLPDYKEMIRGCDEMTKLSKKVNGGNLRFSSDTNYGIQWGGTRGTNNFKNFPFTKIYHKQKELSLTKDKHGSLEFAQDHLQSIDYKDVIRIETTVKNKEHLKLLKVGLNKCNLKELLELSEDNKNKIIASAFNKHLLRNTVKIYKDAGKMTPTNAMYLGHLRLLMNELDYSFDSAVKTMIRPIDCPVSRSTNKKKITRLYEDYIYKTDYVKKAEIIEDIYTEIGLI